MSQLLGAAALLAALLLTPCLLGAAVATENAGLCWWAAWVTALVFGAAWGLVIDQPCASGEIRQLPPSPGQGVTRGR